MKIRKSQLSSSFAAFVILVACGASFKAIGQAGSPQTAGRSWYKVADEGSAFSFSGTREVRFGADTRWVTKQVAGAGRCTNDFFGTDPARGVRKTCQASSTAVASSLPPTPAPSSGGSWIKIASEYQAFSTPSAQTVRYGADTRWVEKVVAGNGACTNSFFGSDPAFGVTKSCMALVSGSTTASAPPPSSGGSWIKIASEFQAFSTPSAQTVRYGADTRWIEKVVTGNGMCTNTFFGSDPAFGVTKSCMALMGGSTTATAPSPTPAPAPSSGASPINIADGTSGLFLEGFFPIGVWMQSKYELAKWKERGINTAVMQHVWDEGGQSFSEQVSQWDQAAAKQGFRTIRSPKTDAREDIGDKTLLAWSQSDEPNAAGGGIPNLPKFTAVYQQLRSIDPKRPVFVNFSGFDVITAMEGPKPDWCKAETGWCSLADNHRDYLRYALDWVGNDLYPFSGHLPRQLEARRNDATLVTEPMDRLETWMNGLGIAKPQFVFIETTNIHQRRGPTSDEVRALIWLSIIGGARGIVYFPQIIEGPNASNDGITPDVLNEMKRQNALISALAPVLQGAIDPAPFSATVPAPLRAGWRVNKSQAYFFVLNPTGATISNATVFIQGVSQQTATVLNEGRSVAMRNGMITDSIPAFALRVYIVPL